MKLLKLITLCVLLVISDGITAKDYYGSLFGIKSDGTTMNTRSIQKAVDYIHDNGGGRLRLFVGRYLTGSIHLKSNVTLHLEEGAILVGSTNPYDYDNVLGWQALIIANGQENIGITGKGLIDGQGRRLANNFIRQIHNGIIKDNLKFDRPANRPKLIYFRECKNVVVKNVTLKNAAFWTQTYDQCADLTIDGITVDSKAYWNNDGMDIVDCNGVVVKNCYVDASDDAICLKSHDPKSICQNIEIRNCVARSSASGIKFGTASQGGFRNIRIINNKIFDTFRSAITMQAVDGGVVENVTVDSLYAFNTGNAVFLRIGERLAGKKGRMNNIRITNLYAEIPAGKPDAGYEYEGPVEDNPRNISPSAITGMPDVPIENVTLENIEIRYPGNGNELYAKVGIEELENVPEKEKGYPEFSMFGELPAWGFYIRHAKGIQFRNVKLIAEKKDYRPAVVLDDVHRSSFKRMDIQIPSSVKEKEEFVQHQSSGITVSK